MEHYHVNCPHCQQTVTVKVDEPRGEYRLRTFWAEHGPSVITTKT